MVEQIDPHRVMNRKMLAFLLVGSDGRVLYADQDIAARLGVVLPSWQGLEVCAFFSSIAPAASFDNSVLEEAARTHQEISCALNNGCRLMIAVRACMITPEILAGLLSEQYPEPVNALLDSPQRAYILSCLCVDHVRHSYRSAAEVKLRSTIGSIIAGFAHEVRNPLAAIVSLAEGVMHPEMEPYTLRALSRIPPLVERIENLLKIALSYGRPRPPRASWHQIGSLLRQSIDILQQAGIRVQSLPLPQEHIETPVFVDREHIISVITNLLQNAIEEAGPERVSIELILQPKIPDTTYLYTHGKLMAVDFVDRGRGVSDDHLEHIFEPFFTTKSNGTGLGLALARDLARLNDGDVLLWRTSSLGSVFRLFLPTFTPESAPMD